MPLDESIGFLGLIVALATLGLVAWQYFRDTGRVSFRLLPSDGRWSSNFMPMDVDRILVKITNTGKKPIVLNSVDLSIRPKLKYWFRRYPDVEGFMNKGVVGSGVPFDPPKQVDPGHIVEVDLCLPTYVRNRYAVVSSITATETTGRTHKANWFLRLLLRRDLRRTRESTEVKSDKVDGPSQRE